MDAKQPNYAEVRSVDMEQQCAASQKEVAEVNEVITPLRSVALRDDRITEQDFQKLLEMGKTTPDVVLRLKREPRRMPQRDRVAAR